MELIDRSIAFAINAHHGQINNHNGEVYLLHVQRVACAVRDAGHPEKFISAAWLHDTIEDSEINLGALQGAIRDNDVVAAVVALTHENNEPYVDYINRVVQNNIARVVKLHDLHDNFRRNHTIQDEATKARLAKKYSEALDILTGVGIR